MRISLPDRPGALGSVATALGAAGADIQSVEIVERTGDQVVDDFIVDVPPATLADELLSACHEVPGVRVLWFSRTIAGSLVTDVELLEQLLADPAQALPQLVAATPRLFHSSWAMVVDSQSILAATANSPESAADIWSQLRNHPQDFDPGAGAQCDWDADWLPGWPETTVAVVPVSAHTLFLVGRTGGPAFFDSELARLRHLVALIRLP